VVGLAAGQNLELLSEQIAEFQPKYIYYQSKNLVPGPSHDRGSKLITDNCTFLPMEILPVIRTWILWLSPHPEKPVYPPPWPLSGPVKKVAIANKEPLVMAGEIITGEAKKSGAQTPPHRQRTQRHLAMPERRVPTAETNPVNRLRRSFPRFFHGTTESGYSAASAAATPPGRWVKKSRLILPP